MKFDPPGVVCGCAIFCVALVGLLFSLLHLPFTHTEEWAVAIVGILLGIRLNYLEDKDRHQ